MSDVKLEGLSMHINGTVGAAGTVSFHFQGCEVENATLPVAEFAVCYLLAMATRSLQQHRSADELVSELDQWQIIASQDSVIKTVYRHRKRLKKLKLAAFLTQRGLLARPDDIGMSLLHRNRHFGYRLAVSEVTIDSPPAAAMLPDFGLPTVWSAVRGAVT